MPWIPRSVYDEVEAKLLRRTEMVRSASLRLARARERMRSLGSMPQELDEQTARRPGVNPHAIHGKGGASDPTARAAMQLERADQALRTALAWVDIFGRADVLFAHQPEGEAARHLYFERLTQQETAERMGVDRQTVRRYRDTYICHCAILAAQAGLLTEAIS